MSPTSEIQNELDTSSGNIFGGQQATIIVVAALTAITLFALFFFFNRKSNVDS